MPNVQAGHGALIALASVALPQTFVTVAELNGDIKWPELSRGETEVTPHQASIDEWVLGIIRRGPLTFGVNFIYNNGTHDHLTGLYSLIKANSMVGVRLRGPGGTTSQDEWIMSGQVQAITQQAPVREGARTCDVTMRMSGPMIIDGVAYGTPVA